MTLDTDRLQELITTLEPAFADEAARRNVLAEAFEDEPVLAQLVDPITMPPGEFTSALVFGLVRPERYLSDGTPALLHVLRVIDTGDNSLQGTLKPFITELAAQQGDVLVMPASGGRRRRRRSALRRFTRRFRKAVRWEVLVIVLLALLIVPIAIVAAAGTDASVRVQESLTGVRRVFTTLQGRTLTQITRQDIDRIGGAVNDLSDSLKNARTQSAVIRNLAFINPDFATTHDMLKVADLSADAAKDMLDGLRPALLALVAGDDATTRSPQTTSGERVIELLQIGQGRFRNAQRQLDEAQRLLESLARANVSTQLLLQLEDIAQYHRQLQSVNRLLVNVPTLLSQAFGVDLPQDYLLLALNNDEIRPSGGYVAAYAYMRMRRFRIVDAVTSPTTLISPNPPPSSLASELAIPDWWLSFQRPIYAAWDGSWHADFSKTAQLAGWFYEQGNNPRAPVKGVVAVDLSAVESILDAVGAVTVPGAEAPVDASTVRAAVYSFTDEGRLHRFMAALYDAILKQWQNVPQERSTAVLNATLKALREKHILIFFVDPDLNALINLLGWSGTQTAPDGDYVMLADTSLDNKSSHSVERQLTYDVQLQPDGSAVCRATLSYKLPAANADADPAFTSAHYGEQRDYRNLLQLFVPRGSSLTGSDNLDSPVVQAASEHYAIYITRVTVEYDSDKRVQYSYTTPSLVRQFGNVRRYRLLLQKQPGSRTNAATVTVTLPKGTKAVRITPEPAATFQLDSTVLEFRLMLDVDQQIEILYQ